MNTLNDNIQLFQNNISDYYSSAPCKAMHYDFVTLQYYSTQRLMKSLLVTVSGGSESESGRRSEGAECKEQVSHISVWMMRGVWGVWSPHRPLIRSWSEPWQIRSVSVHLYREREKGSCVDVLIRGREDLQREIYQDPKGLQVNGYHR